ncbi:MAG: c-type cytochrome [Mariprofundales bacterium]|nr:c-type cytochrome [Mariprofundales bacterium]
MKKTILSLATVAFCAAIAQPAMADDIDVGKIFSKRCKMCHSFDHRKVGPAFKDMHKDPAVLKATMIHGRKMMPKWGSRLSAAEIDAMVAFIISKQKD